MGIRVITALGSSVLVLRNETERPEAVEADKVKLAGVFEENLKKLAKVDALEKIYGLMQKMTKQ